MSEVASMSVRHEADLIPSSLLLGGWFWSKSARYQPRGFLELESTLKPLLVSQMEQEQRLALARQFSACLLHPLVGLPEYCLCPCNDLGGSGELLAAVGSERVGVDTVGIAVHSSLENGVFPLDQNQ